MQKYNGALLRKFDDPVQGNASVGTSVVVRKKSDNSIAPIYSVDDINSIQKPNPFTTDAFGRYSFFAPNGKYILQFGDGSDEIEISMVDNLDHNSLSGRNAAGAHSASAISNANGGSVQDFIDTNTFKTVADMKAFTNHVVGSKVVWQGYYSQSDGGSNCGVVKSGPHVEDMGSIFSIDANTYIEANLKGKRLNVRKFGTNFETENNAPFINAAIAFLHDGSQLYFPQGNNAGEEYKITEKIINNKRIDFVGDTYWGSIIRNNNVNGEAAVECNTTWYQTISKLAILGNPLSGDGLVINSSNFKLIRCRIDSHGHNGVFIVPQNWTIQLARNLIRSNGQDGINAVATGPTGQINALDIDKNSITFNGRDGIRCCGANININGGTIEENQSIGVRVTTEFYSTYGVSVENVHMEGNKDGHVYFNCYPSKGFQVFKANIEKNYFLLNAATSNVGAAVIAAVTDTPHDGIIGINIRNTNMILTDSLKHVSLGNAISKQAQSKIETVMTGDTSDYSLFYENVGNCAIRPYQKTKTLSGYFGGRGTISYSSPERSANINASILAGAMTLQLATGMKVGDQIKKIGVRIATDNTNYSLIFNIYKRDSSSTAGYILATTQTLSSQSGSAFRQSADLSTLTNTSNIRVKANEEYYLEIVVQSASGGGTFFYLYNPILYYYE